MCYLIQFFHPPIECKVYAFNILRVRQSRIPGRAPNGSPCRRCSSSSSARGRLRMLPRQDSGRSPAAAGYVSYEFLMIEASLRNAIVSSGCPQRCSSACMCTCSVGQCDKRCSVVASPLLQRGQSALGAWRVFGRMWRWPCGTTTKPRQVDPFLA